MQTKTHPEIVHQIVAHHGPIPGKEVVAMCVSVGYTNKQSTSAILFNARKAGTLLKDEQGQWTVAPEKAG